MTRDTVLIDSSNDDSGMSQKLDVVIPTFYRSSHLVETIQSLVPSGHLVRSIFVVDNGQSSATQEDCREVAGTTGLPVVYLDPGGNIGPAGATAHVMDLMIAAGRDDHWLLRLDDDRPLPVELLSLLLDEAQAAFDEDPRTAAVGLEGAIWKRYRARLVPPKRGGGRFVNVDYLKTGQFPLFHTGAMRTIGGFRADLFFGMTEVEYGIRARRSNFTLKEAARLRHFSESRNPARRSFVRRSYVRRSLGRRSDWRRYYSLRNLLVILLENGQPFTAVRVGVTRGLLKPLLALAFNPHEGAKNLRLSSRATWDALRRRMGKTLDPYEWAKYNNRLSGGDMP